MFAIIALIAVLAAIVAAVLAAPLTASPHHAPLRRRLRDALLTAGRRLSNYARDAASHMSSWVPPRRLPDVYLEGNIGAGKSTLATALALTGRFSVHQEPVAEWRNLEGYNFLRQLQVDYRRYVFLFQVVVLATLARRLRFARPSRKQRIFERSSRCALEVFCRAADDRGFLDAEQFIALRALYEATAPTPPVVYLYVRTPPDVAKERAERRGRPEEKALPGGYFERLHRLTEDWLLRNETNTVYILDGTLDPAQLLDAALEALEKAARDF